MGHNIIVRSSWCVRTRDSFNGQQRSLLFILCFLQAKMSQTKRPLPTLRLKAQCVIADRSLEDINDNYRSVLSLIMTKDFDVT